MPRRRTRSWIGLASVGLGSLAIAFAAVLAVALILGGQGGTLSQEAVDHPEQSPTSTAAAATTKPPAKTKPPTKPPTKTKPPVPTSHPTAATTGVPAGLTLHKLPVRDGAYRVTKNNTVLDRVHIPGDLLITADHVTIKNSQIDGSVLDEYSGRQYSFTITDSTVGPAQGCLTAPGVGEANYTATRVHIRGHGDGFRASGDNVNIQHSFVRLCSNPGDHSDGLQTYHAGRGLILNHTTIDQRGVKDFTAPIFIADPAAVDVTVTNNLVMGGTYSIQVKKARGTVIVRGNMLVDKSWVYGPVEADCHSLTWADNSLVTIDDNYRITSIVGPLPCAT